MNENRRGSNLHCKLLKVYQTQYDYNYAPARMFPISSPWVNWTKSSAIRTAKSTARPSCLVGVLYISC